MPNYVRNLIIILVVLLIAIWIDLPSTTGIRIPALGIDKTIETRLGLDLVGGVQTLLEADVPPGTPIDPAAMDTAVKIVDNRVNGLGVNEASTQKAGENRIVVELPGETDPVTAQAAIKQTGQLEFVDMSSITPQEAFSLELQTIKTDLPTGSSVEATATEPVTGTSPLLDRVWPTVMTGSELSDVSVTTSQTGEYQVAFKLKDQGARIFADFTRAHVGDVLAIVLDKQVISTPTIQNPITDGQGVITGNYTLETANTMAVQLRYGSLPIPLRVVESRTVGPSLGQDSLQKSMRAGLIGFSIVILFMILYYRLPGVVAVIAILIYAVVAYAIFRWIPVTLTLPGIAGFLLSTGSALDANILIFERMKEELRAGRTLLQSMDQGWKRAWPSIRDSNIATLITCAILFWFGSAFGATIVKGFSLTLALGVAVSLFTAIFVTRAILHLVFSYFKPTDKARWFGI